VYDFCPHCSQTLEHEQVAGRMLVCANCGKDIGYVGQAQRVSVGETAEKIRAGSVAHCPVCQQAVQLKGTGEPKTLVPHYAAKDSRKICPGSGKPVASKSPAPVAKDLSTFMSRDIIKMISCTRKGEIKIEMLTLEYLDKSERVRIQIEAMREILGPDFRMGEYPPSLNKPHLGVWASAEMSIVAVKHAQGGYQSIADAEIAAVLADLRQWTTLFFK
jgi:DNA-directed RNA polymerase subunit RPC12/RpoP